MRRSTPWAAAALVGVLALSGCWGRSPAPLTPSAQSPTPTALTMDCTDPIDESDAVASGMRTYLDVVAFTAQQAEPVARDGTLWAKTGIQLRAGARFEIRSITPGVSMNWSNTGDDRFTTRLVVAGCQGTTHGAWLTYPGGFEVKAPVCAELEVVAGDRSERACVPLGVAC